jgi:hypothetical protein
MRGHARREHASFPREMRTSHRCLTGLVFLFAAGSWIACINPENGRPSGAAGQPSTTSSTTGAPPAICVPNAACRCADGNAGVTTCAGLFDDSATCDCGCAPFNPESPVQPTGCGGEPFGTWRLQSLEANGIPFVFGGAGQFTCPTRVTRSPDKPELRLQLKDGGDALIYRENLNVGVEISASCPSERFGFNYPCDHGGLPCGAPACGVCHCGVGESMVESEALWMRSGNTLILSSVGPQGVVEKYVYCIQNDTMTLFTPSGFKAVMTRVQGFGTPAPCEARDAAHCAVGHGGCQTGACVGDGGKCADATTEGDCTNRQGCSWDPSECAGTPASTCSLADYDVVPGCRFLSSAATCAGTPKPCADNTTSAACTAAPGCRWQAGCVGGPVDCSKYDHACTYCGETAGCSCDSLGLCRGSATCEMQDVFGCRLYDNCQLIPFLCQGTPTSCDQFPVASCTGVDGCHVQESPADAGSAGDGPRADPAGE